jgi:hypothetical protein
MPLPRFLRRLFGRRRPPATQQERYAAAEELEKNTQAHYRAVTGSDASGQPTKKQD